MAEIVAWLSYYGEPILYGIAIMFALVSVLMRRHKRPEQPTYDFPKDDEGAYKPIVSETFPQKHSDRAERHH